MKEYLKKYLTPILASHPVSSIANKIFNSGVPVFMLHRVEQQHESNTGKVTSIHIRNCLDYLVRHDYTFLSLEKLLQLLMGSQDLPSKSVVFTMDDGYADQAEIVSPIFLEYNCPLTFFIITGMLDQSIWPWDAKTSWIFENSVNPSLQSCATIKNLNLNLSNNASKTMIRRSTQDALKRIATKDIPDILQQLAYDAEVTIPDNAPDAYRSMTWDMARKLESQGIRFAPHSVSHNILSRLGQKSMQIEIQQSWNKIANELENPLKVFCYPNGKPIDYGQREIEMIQDAHYLGAVSTTPGFVKSGNNHNNYRYSLPRLALPHNMTDFIQYCSWIESAKESLYKTS